MKVNKKEVCKELRQFFSIYNTMEQMKPEERVRALIFLNDKYKNDKFKIGRKA